jgi:CBS domain-containing protein
MNVEHWMTRTPEVLHPEESALDALERMTEGGFRHLPVVNETGAAIGMVSIDDLRAALPFDVGVGTPLPESARAVARHYKIAELMTYLPVTVRSTTPLKEALSQLAERRIGCLPITDPHGALVGIFTETDALRAFLAFLAGGDESRALPHPPARNERARELTQVVAELRAERARIAAALGQKERQNVPPSSPTTAFDGNLAELASWRLRELARALDHVDSGVFGRCSTCGRDIPATRLHVLPSTRHCVRCARAAANQPVAS